MILKSEISFLLNEYIVFVKFQRKYKLQNQFFLFTPKYLGNKLGKL